MSTIYVKPAPGGRVRMPERNFIPMPAEGAFVSRVDFYERLLIGGDVIECEPPVQPPATETEAKAAISAPARASSKEK